MTRWLLAACAYFALVFSAGFALGVLRVLLLVLVLALQGQSIEAYLAGRDPLAFGAYVLALLVFAALPGLLHRRTA